MNRTVKFSLLGLVLAGAGVAVYAANGGAHNDALSVPVSAVSLAQAISTAEGHAHGRATRAELDRGKHGWAYDVEVVNGRQVLDVQVDPTAGTVISAAADQMDHEDKDEQD